MCRTVPAVVILAVALVVAIALVVVLFALAALAVATATVDTVSADPGLVIAGFGSAAKDIKSRQKVPGQARLRACF